VLKNTLLAFFCLLLSFNAAAMDVYYGGFSYLSEKKDFPYTNSLNIVRGGKSAIDEVLIKKVKLVKIKNFELKLDDLADISDDVMAMTLALDSEITSVEKIGDQYKLLILLSAQILLFDYKNMQIVATYPIDIQYNDSLDHKPTEEDILESYKEVYFGDSNVNVLSIFIDRIQQIDPKKKYSNHIKIVNVGIKDKLMAKLGNGISQDQLIQLMGQNFTRFLSINQSVSVLPFTKGHAIGQKLAVRYANSGEPQMMEIPEPDYAIDISLVGLKKKEFSKNSSGTAYIYATQAKFKFYEPLSEEIYYQGKLFNAATKKVPTSQSTVMDWPSYSETLIVLFDQVTKAVGKPDKKWFKKHSSNAPNFKQFKSIKKVLKQCRS
jgi:hypothetical protein